MVYTLQGFSNIKALPDKVETSKVAVSISHGAVNHDSYVVLFYLYHVKLCDFHHYFTRCVVMLWVVKIEQSIT